MRCVILVVMAMLWTLHSAPGAPGERSCETAWEERDFLITATGNGDLERLARVEARIVNSEGKSEEAGPYVLVRHLSGSEASFYFAIGDSFHSLRPGQSKRIFIEAPWRTGPKGGVLLKCAFCK